jgi:hypothetical protein
MQGAVTLDSTISNSGLGLAMGKLPFRELVTLGAVLLRIGQETTTTTYGANTQFTFTGRSSEGSLCT